MVLTGLGILLLIATVLLLVFKSSILKDEHASKFLKSLAKGKGIVAMGIVGILLLVQSSFWFYARPGHQYYIVSPAGTKSAIFSSGVKFVMPFSKIQEWQKFFDIKVITGDEDTEGIEGVIHGGIPIRFIDQVTANVNVSVRMQMPEDEASFIKLGEEFRHPKNLVNNTLMPTVKEQVINTGYMFSAQDYISGAAADFRQTLDEQLKGGGYSVEKKEMYDTTFLNINIQQNEVDRQIKDIQTRYEVTKRERNGVPIRVPHDITKNNIIVSQVIVDQVGLEDAFKKRLEKQRDISAQKRIELEMIETAKAAQQRIVAEGERDKAAERVTKEKEQVGVIIAIETKLKQEKTNKELAQIQLETQRINTQTIKAQADADYYKNLKLVSAGLTPQEKAEWEYKTSVGVATELAKIKLPTTYINGSSSTKGNGVLVDLLGAKVAEGMLGNK